MTCRGSHKNMIINTVCKVGLGQSTVFWDANTYLSDIFHVDI